jgi:hypothetical protein
MEFCQAISEKNSWDVQRILSCLWRCFANLLNAKQRVRYDHDFCVFKVSSPTALADLDADSSLNSVIAVSVGLLCKIVCTADVPLTTVTPVEDRFLFRKNQETRRKLASDLMLTGFISDMKSLTHDPEWRNFETFLRGLEPRYVLVSWDRVLLGVKNRLLYAASINIVADSVNEDNERIFFS